MHSAQALEFITEQSLLPSAFHNAFAQIFPRRLGRLNSQSGFCGRFISLLG